MNENLIKISKGVKETENKLRLIDTYLETEEYLGDISFPKWLEKNGVKDRELIIKEYNQFHKGDDDNAAENYADFLEDLYELKNDEYDVLEEAIELSSEEEEEESDLSASGRERRRARRAKREAEKAAKKKKKAAKKAARKAKQAARKTYRKEKKAAKKAWKAGGKQGGRKGFKGTKAGLKTEKKLKIFEQREKIAASRGKLGRKMAKGFQKLKTASPALIAIRGAFLGVVRLNIWDIAGKIKGLKDAKDEKSKKAYKVFAQKWYNKGGNRTKLAQNLDKGAKKKPIIIRFKKSHGIDGVSQYDIFDENKHINFAGYDDATILSMIAAAMTVITGAISALKSAGQPSLDIPPEDLGSVESASEEAEEQAVEEMKDEIMSNPNLSDEEKSAMITNLEMRGTDDSEGDDVGEDTILGMPRPLAIGVGVAVLTGVGFGIYKLATRKKQ